MKVSSIASKIELQWEVHVLEKFMIRKLKAKLMLDSVGGFS